MFLSLRTIIQKLASFSGNTIQIFEDEIAPSSVKPLNSRASFGLDNFENEVIVIIFLPVFPLTITSLKCYFLHVSQEKSEVLYPLSQSRVKERLFAER